MNKPYKKILLYACVSFLLLVSACGVNAPETLDYHNKILFTSHRSGKDQLYMMNPDGTDIVQLTSGEYWHNAGRWSPDAQKIVCNTGENPSLSGIEIVVMNSDGSNRKLLDRGDRMSWYIDGSYIVYATPYPLPKIYRIDSNGENKTYIYDSILGSPFSFSPDGSKIACWARQDSVGKVATLDYPSFSNLTFIGPSDSYTPNWSSNGKELTFYSKSNIFTINEDGSNLHQITNRDEDKYGMQDPCWSPDSKRIIFIAKDYLYMVNKDGTNLHKVIDDNSVTSCDWSR